MSLRDNLFEPDESDRAVSPVIGVILMVAITVILAAVIGTFVLQIGSSAGNSAPQASLSVDTNTNANTIEIEHIGGDSVDSTRTRVIIDVAGTEMSYDETGSGNQSVLPVGTTAIVELNKPSNSNNPEVINWDDQTATGGVRYDYWDTSDTISGLDQGDQVTITIIDVESQRKIFETTVTA